MSTHLAIESLAPTNISHIATQHKPKTQPQLRSSSSSSSKDLASSPSRILNIILKVKHVKCSQADGSYVLCKMNKGKRSKRRHLPEHCDEMRKVGRRKKMRLSV